MICLVPKCVEMRRVSEEVKGACYKINTLAIMTEDPQIPCISAWAGQSLVHEMTIPAWGESGIRSRVLPLSYSGTFPSEYRP